MTSVIRFKICLDFFLIFSLGVGGGGGWVCECVIVGFMETALAYHVVMRSDRSLQATHSCGESDRTLFKCTFTQLQSCTCHL